MRERAPIEWAAAQNDLGNALAKLGQRDNKPARLEEAVAAYREALKERTRERAPIEWAATQNDLGIALGDLGSAKISRVVSRKRSRPFAKR